MLILVRIPSGNSEMRKVRHSRAGGKVDSHLNAHSYEHYFDPEVFCSSAFAQVRQIRDFGGRSCKICRGAPCTKANTACWPSAFFAETTAQCTWAAPFLDGVNAAALALMVVVTVRLGLEVLDGWYSALLFAIGLYRAASLQPEQRLAGVGGAGRGARLHRGDVRAGRQALNTKRTRGAKDYSNAEALS